MALLTPGDYLDIHAYEEAIDATHVFGGIVLFELSRHNCITRDIIIRNFLARTDVLLKAILHLWQINDLHDCWVLHRCLMDRLFHLSELDVLNEFDLFEEWSFFEQYKAQNKIRSDIELAAAKTNPLFTPSQDEAARAKILSKAPPEWHRPKAEDVAKRLDMTFLYKYGYDFASRHVHPMANDGERDFFEITHLEPAPSYPDQRVVLSNSILVGSMIFQVGLNASSFKWRHVVFNFLSELREHLQGGNATHLISLAKIADLFHQNVELSERKD